jgi:predicted acetyltransferase
VALVPASKSDESTIKNLLHLYVHDFSEFLGLKPSEEGWFSYPALPLYWSEAGRSAFLIRSGGSLVGFALVSQGSVVSGDPTVRDLAEFFVVRGVRRRGVGQAAAHCLFRSMPGKWESGSVTTICQLSSFGEARSSCTLDLYSKPKYGIAMMVRGGIYFVLRAPARVMAAHMAPNKSLERTRER